MKNTVKLNPKLKSTTRNQTLAPNVEVTELSTDSNLLDIMELVLKSRLTQLSLKLILVLQFRVCPQIMGRMVIRSVFVEYNPE